MHRYAGEQRQCVVTLETKKNKSEVPLRSWISPPPSGEVFFY